VNGFEHEIFIAKHAPGYLGIAVLRFERELSNICGFEGL
jgi:hypothetical protein